MGQQTTMEERFGKCPYATAQILISGKWAVLLLLYLEEGPIRFNLKILNGGYDPLWKQLTANG